MLKQELVFRSLPVVWNTTVGANPCPSDHQKPPAVRDESGQVLHRGLGYSLRQLWRVGTERQLVHDLGVGSNAWKHVELECERDVYFSASLAGFSDTQYAFFKNSNADVALA